MTQNLHDDPAFFADYSKLPRPGAGLGAAPEWPSLGALLPPLGGLRVVDLGCGFRWFCRFARAEGAAQVLGLDLSENMLAKARRDTADPAIQYQRADFERVALPAAGRPPRLARGQLPGRGRAADPLVHRQCRQAARTIGTTLNSVISVGFTIAHMEEWSPTDAQVSLQPELAEERERPTILLVAADRT